LLEAGVGGGGGGGAGGVGLGEASKEDFELLLQSFLKLFTLTKDTPLLLLNELVSSAVLESAEKRLEVAPIELATDAREASAWRKRTGSVFGDSRRAKDGSTTGAEGKVDGKRPKGSGDKGIMGGDAFKCPP
jgi:hypothetical protein